MINYLLKDLGKKTKPLIEVLLTIIVVSFTVSFFKANKEVDYFLTKDQFSDDSRIPLDTLMPVISRDNEKINYNYSIYNLSSQNLNTDIPNINRNSGNRLNCISCHLIVGKGSHAPYLMDKIEDSVNNEKMRSN